MTTQQMLDERYGRSPGSGTKRLLSALVAVAAAAAIGWLVWVTVSTSLRSVDFDATAFTVIDERNVTVTFQLTTPGDGGAFCALEAQDVEHGVVGWRVVELPSTGGRAHSVTLSLPTVAEATSGFVNHCWAS